MLALKSCLAALFAVLLGLIPAVGEADCGPNIEVLAAQTTYKDFLQYLADEKTFEAAEAWQVAWHEASVGVHEAAETDASKDAIQLFCDSLKEGTDVRVELLVNVIETGKDAWTRATIGSHVQLVGAADEVLIDALIQGYDPNGPDVNTLRRVSTLKPGPDTEPSIPAPNLYGP